MANSKIKATVVVDGDPEETTLQFSLTAEQSVILLRAINMGNPVHISLETPVAGYGYDSTGKLRAIREDPEAYSS